MNICRKIPDLEPIVGTLGGRMRLLLFSFAFCFPSLPLPSQYPSTCLSHLFQSVTLMVGTVKALTCFLPMLFQKHAQITVTNEGAVRTDAFYFNIVYRAYTKALPADLLYFHAQYRQAAPDHGWTNDWKSNGDRIVNDKKNLNGDGNYVWMEATGRGHFAGVTMSVLQNQDGWWGEGDDMFFVDG